MDPLIKSCTQPLRTTMYPEPSTRTHEELRTCAELVPSRESGQVGTKLEPDSIASPHTSRPRPTKVEPTGTRRSKRVTYRELLAYVRAHYGISPRTGWIAHVKELNGLRLRPTHNRQGARVDGCPPQHRVAIEEALRDLGLLLRDSP